MAPARRAGDNAMNAAGHPLDRYDWTRILGQLDAEGWAPLPALFDPPQARELARAFDDPAAVRIGGERDERRALRLPAPPLLRDLPRALHARLLPLAQSWAQRLGHDIRYPPGRMPGGPRRTSTRRPSPACARTALKRCGTRTTTRRSPSCWWRCCPIPPTTSAAANSS
ncbi:hypothetical protein WJ972_18795 [Achromobacter insuavis]